ncbi:4'-phosphopantetheinyl transferase superfamily protein [Aquimarina gracilis]|uniref:4'-phosphopantetheinyl transferase superfamily protein n=1 Tax=Aquimarina gracilis TaxID=874422 RepID=A0ABU5ZX40_9FLAO|nr:4'-phosphopantetheinyl transferase superfamily protein [Aquimarina gracilis]MEB3346410.1 4'-phosphopantetheinyl transferase superfamily protein [Aquimarina gracilis]
MIGNDIVDLQLAKIQSNWKREKWLQKLFTERELQCISSSAYPEIEVWVLWSRKEAAYKAHQRRFGFKSKFNPKSFENQNDAVNINGFRYQTSTHQTQKYVYSIAKIIGTEPFSEVFEQEISVRAQFADKMLQRLGDSSLISFRKDKNGVPILCINNVPSEISFSFTHHGKYNAYTVIF